MNPQGILITFEGLDGCGKSTQLAREAERLRKLGREVVVTSEPGGTVIGRQIREIVLNSASGPLAPATELALMFAARAQHLSQVIGPAIKAGQIVLCDRFTDSTIAYQGYGRGIPLGDIDDLNRIICNNACPDLTLFLDIDPELAAARTVSRNRAAFQKNTRFEEEGLEFFRRVRQGYYEIAKSDPGRVHIVDGRGAETDVARRVTLSVDDFLRVRTGAS